MLLQVAQSVPQFWHTPPLRNWLEAQQEWVLPVAKQVERQVRQVLPVPHWASFPVVGQVVHVPPLLYSPAAQQVAVLLVQVRHLPVLSQVAQSVPGQFWHVLLLTNWLEAQQE